MKETSENEVLLSLGSNMGDRRANIEEAVRLISGIPGVSDIRLSGMYETEPVGYEDQDYFYNICMLINTSLSPAELLGKTQEIERMLHRERHFRWGPRTIDIDIILYGDMKIDTDNLTVPHPRYKERAFVLVPMKDIMEYDGNIPDGKSVRRIPWEFEV